MRKREVVELLPDVGVKRLNFLMDDATPKITATRLALAAGYNSHTYVAKMRKGDPKSMKVIKASAEAMCQMLGCELDYLFQESNGKAVHTISGSRSSQTAVLDSVA